MKYYGSIYKALAGKYDISNMQEYSNPYDALKAANDEWNSSPDFHTARLLVVFGKPSSTNETSLEAYFQFTDSKSCNTFIKNKCKIEWSTLENQIWNGNAAMMY